MTNQARSIPEYGELTTPSGNTTFVVDHVANGVSNTYSLDITHLAPAVFSVIPGPYSNDAAANTANVAVGSPYYDSSGIVHIRLT